MINDNQTFILRLNFFVVIVHTMSKNNIFFMEIFNDISKINNTTFIILYNTNGNIWFGLRDILKVIGYTSLENAMVIININVKLTPTVNWMGH